MNIIKLKVNFENRTCIKDGIILTENDFNSTKIQFEFDKDGRKVFEMNNPNGELTYAKTIVNNELILAGEDENHNPCSLFAMPGKYQFEISLYDGDSKLTSASDYLYVAPEEVKIGDDVAEVYLPLFDEMNTTLSELIDETNNLDIDANKSGTIATITITKKDGTTEEVEIQDGEHGKDAKINGVNTISIQAGSNITLNQADNTLTINANVPDVSNFITKSVDDLVNYYKKTETYTQAEVNSLIGAISTMNILVVQSLPTQDISTTTIYLVPRTTSEANNVYDEYIYVSNN